MTPDDEADALMAQMAEDGVSVRNVTDGQVFAFRLDTLEALVAAAREAGQDACLVFVQTKRRPGVGVA